VDPIANSWLASQLLNAVYEFGTWFQARRDETVKVPAPKNDKPMMHKPKYSEDELRHMLGIPDKEPGAIGYKIGERVYSDAEIERMAQGLMSRDDD
jgi:hypothetical protein